jgi:hypothetical protein
MYRSYWILEKENHKKELERIRLSDLVPCHEAFLACSPISSLWFPDLGLRFGLSVTYPRETGRLAYMYMYYR